jgi:microcystin-dependent protein
VGDRFNICFYNNNAPVSVLSATNTGTPANNVVDLTGVFRINGTNVLDNSVLIGSISMFPFTLGSPQYCLCDGRAISRTTYSILFALMGTTYGSGNGSTTFNVPNFSGIFLRGNGSQVINSNTYASASIGTAQQDSLLDHVHNGASSSYLSGSTTGASTNGIASVCSSTYIVSSSFPNTGSVNSTYRSNTTENRPVNHSINYYIKVL